MATALNNLKQLDPVDLDNVAQGSLAGITTVLTKSWGDLSVDFPFPSMVGSGDRMGLYWAVYGSAPTLRQGVAAQPTSALQHACQGLALDASGGTVRHRPSITAAKVPTPAPPKAAAALSTE